LWSNNSVSTYLLLKPNSKIKDVEKKMIDLIMVHAGEEIKQYMGITMEEFLSKGNKYGYFFQNLKEIHLDPSIKQEFKEAGDPKYLTILGSLAILIILIAAINFMNLSTAQASRRAKEVVIKKIGGSSRGMLIMQFLTESYILAAISMIFALVLVKLFLPNVNNMLGTNLLLKLFDDCYTLPALIFFSLIVGFLSGSYPAFYISSFNPYEVLKGGTGRSYKIGVLRRILIVFQFAVSILLIAGTLIMNKQIRYMLNKDLGFHKEQLLVINKIEKLGTRVKAFKEEVKGIPGVINIVSSSSVPGQNNNDNGYGLEGRKNEMLLMWTNFVDYDFLETYGMRLESGRTFNKLFAADRNACIINESAVKKYAITDLEKTRIIEPGDTNKADYMKIIGVVKNFNTESLHTQVQPCILRLENGYWPYGYLTVKLSGQNNSKTISDIEKIWKEYTVNNPLEYYFLDDGLKRLYVKEKQSMQMAVLFSILAIFIASLGLFGLTSFTIEQRTKEIGVRKAMGSSIAGIYLQILKEIFLLISISALIACPVIYYFAGKWLENFYYRIHPGFFTFFAGLTVVIGIAILTVSYRVIKAARVNPAQSLKYE
jgi:putative ABC transport system permease protein